MSKIEFRILADPLSIPCFQGRPEAYRAFVAKLERIWASVDARVGSAEAFMPIEYADDADTRTYSEETRVAANEPVVFEINFNSNYNRKAEEMAGVNGAREVAAMLIKIASSSEADQRLSTLPPTLLPTLPPTLPPSLSPPLPPSLTPTLPPSLSPALSPELPPSLSPPLSSELPPSLSPELVSNLLTTHQQSCSPLILDV